MRSAHVAVVSGIGWVLTGGRRRYRCARCGKTVWRRKLRRRVSELPSLAPATQATGGAKVTAYLAMTVLLVSGVLLMKSCSYTPVDPVRGSIIE